MPRGLPRKGSGETANIETDPNQKSNRPGDGRLKACLTLPRRAMNLYLVCRVCAS
jgi:hypothetical protein